MLQRSLPRVEIVHTRYAQNTTQSVADLMYPAMHSIGVCCQRPLSGKALLAGLAMETTLVFFRHYLKMFRLHVGNRVREGSLANCFPPRRLFLHEINPLLWDPIVLKIGPAARFLICQPCTVFQECAFPSLFRVKDGLYTRRSALNHAQTIP